MTDLKAFLATYADKPFAWGVDDCCLFLADWIEANYGFDPAASVRRTYRDKQSCHRLLFWSGGMVRLVSRLVSGAGIDRIPAHQVRDGDIALIRVKRLKVGAIRVGRYWAVRNERVGFVSKAKVIRAWRI
jgi:hypothetical protein